MARWATGLRRVAAVLVVSLAVLAGTAPSARAADQVSAYTVKATLARDGSLAVKATLTFDGAAPADVRQVFDTVSRTADHMEYRFTLTNVSASADGKDLGAKVSVGGGSTTVDIPTGGAATVELDYTVLGAAIATAGDTTTVSWPLLQGLSLPVATFDAEIGVPGLFTLVDCAAGDPAAPGACTFYGGGTHDNPSPTFHHEGAGAGQVVIATLRFPSSAVTANQDLRQLWSLDRAFSAAPLPLGIALGLLLVGGLALWAAHRKVGRDATAGVATLTLVAEFRPVGPDQSEFRVLDGVRPGEVGTLMDERVDPIDITATLLDLAVRGHLVITELPRGSAHAPSDWSFARAEGSDKLLDYEHTLLDAVAPVQGEPVLVSNLAGSVGAVIGAVQSELYDEVVARGWFARRPDATRNQWALVGWIGLGVAVVATVLLAAFTSFGLAGLALIALALGVVFVGQEMPARTAKGTGVLGGLDVLRGSLLTQPVNTLPTGKGYQQLSSILPYAIVLGGKERWLQAVADSDDDGVPDPIDLAWYHAPETWHLTDLPASLANFVTTVQGTLFSR